MRPRRVSLLIAPLIVLAALALSGCEKPEPTEVAPPGGKPAGNAAAKNSPGGGGGVNTGPRPTLQ